MKTEKRITDFGGTDSLKAENNKYMAGFKKAGEQVTLIEHDHKKTMDMIINEMDVM